MGAPTLAISMLLSTMQAGQEAPVLPSATVSAPAISSTIASTSAASIAIAQVSAPVIQSANPAQTGTPADTSPAPLTSPVTPPSTPAGETSQTITAPQSTEAETETADRGYEEAPLIVVTGREGAPPEDPLQALNVKSFNTVQSIDKAFVGPVAIAYKEKVPPPIRKGLRNFINNLTEPVVFFNYLLQLKPGKAVETLGRFTVNTTLGVAGLFDVAKKKPFNLPYRSNGFANTLGYYGVKQGAYLYLPFIGSTTVRDLFGRGVDLMFFPVAIGKPFTQPAFTLSLGVIDSLDDRAEFEDELKVLRDESGDPYTAFRERYLEQREAEIDALHGLYRAVPIPDEIPILTGPPATASAPATPSAATPSAAAQPAGSAAPATTPGTSAPTTEAETEPSAAPEATPEPALQ